MDWKYPFQLAHCNPQLIPVLRTTCPTTDTLIQTWRNLTIRPFVIEHTGANPTDPAQPWPPTPPALVLGTQRFPGEKGKITLDRFIKRVPAVRACARRRPPTRPSSEEKGEVDATAPTRSAMHEQQPVGAWVMRDFIWTLWKQKGNGTGERAAKTWNDLFTPWKTQ